MFRPELKDTGWEYVPEIVFEITGDKYEESHFDTIKYEYERPDGGKIMLSKPNFDYSIPEKKIATIINDALIDVLWDSITVSELEQHLSDSIEDSAFNIVKFRLSMETDGVWRDTIEISDCIYGWVHYKEDKKIKTFRFQIGLDGSFKKC
jgi:hypothetical protein